jgi:hypothetical protein
LHPLGNVTGATSLQNALNSVPEAIIFEMRAEPSPRWLDLKDGKPASTPPTSLQMWR